MAVNWAEQVGTVVCGWLLETYWGMREDRACFLAVNAADSRRALIQFVAEGSPDAERLRSCWRTGGRLSDPHLLAVYESGETQIGEELVSYCAQEQPDDSLGYILRDRPLEADEARAMSIAVARALDYLHERGLRHGAVEAANLFIVGEEVKLSADTISAGSEPERRQDLVQFGNLLLEAHRATRAAMLPEPFRKIAQECLRADSGWTADRVVQELDTPHGARPVLLPRVNRGAWILAASGAVAVVALSIVFFVQRDAEPVVSHAPSTAAAPDKPSPAVPFGTASRATAVASAPIASGDSDRATQLKSTAKTWAIISATYRDYDAAQKRADRIGQTTKVKAMVHPPRGQGARYYVILGSGLTQEEAENLLAKARAAGAPGDSYVTKLETDR